MNTTLKVLSLLLTYPTEELLKGLPDLKSALAEDAALGDRELKLVTRQIGRASVRERVFRIV